jgi:hypothetical protein
VPSGVGQHSDAVSWNVLLTIVILSAANVETTPRSAPVMTLLVIVTVPLTEASPS